MSMFPSPLGTQSQYSDISMNPVTPPRNAGTSMTFTAWTVQIGGVDDSTALRRPDYLLNHLNQNEHPEVRIQRRLLLEPVRVPLESFSCIQELVSVLIDIVDVHEYLVFHCGILHCDVSIRNTMMYIFSGHWPIRSNIPATRKKLTLREKILDERKFRRGLLIDFDYARFMDGNSAVSEGERAGTVPFMALDILRAFGSEAEVDAVHKPKHDLESIIYVLVWICVLYSNPKCPENQPLHAHNTCLRSWTTCKTRSDIEALWSTKTGELHTRVPLQHFTSYFKGLKPYVERLYTALINDRQDTPSLTHGIVRDILLDAFLEVEEPSSDVAHVRRNSKATVLVKRKAELQVHTTLKRTRGVTG